MCLDCEVSPEHMVPGTKYVVKYGSTQRDTSLGSKTRQITVKRQGLSSDMDLYRPGTPVHGGVWVVDHSDNDREKFFFHSRFIDVQTDWFDLI